MRSQSPDAILHATQSLESRAAELDDARAEQMLAQDLGVAGVEHVAQKGFSLLLPDGSHRTIYVDFLIRGLVVEVDGSWHRKTQDIDAWRDKELVAQGKCSSVLRVSNSDVYSRKALGKILGELPR